MAITQSSTQLPAAPQPSAVNLLPWREALRQRRRKGFLVMLLACVTAAALLILLLDRLATARLHSQAARNRVLQTEAAAAQARLAESERLRQQSTDLRAHGAVIAGLQAARPVTVHLLDEFVDTLPDGIYYRRVARHGDAVTIDGVAESYAPITELMRRLNASRWLQQGTLSSISAAAPASGDMSAGSYDFSLSLSAAAGVSQPAAAQPDESSHASSP